MYSCAGIRAEEKRIWENVIWPLTGGRNLDGDFKMTTTNCIITPCSMCVCVRSDFRDLPYDDDNLRHR